MSSTKQSHLFQELFAERLHGLNSILNDTKLNLDQINQNLKRNNKHFTNNYDQNDDIGTDFISSSGNKDVFSDLNNDRMKLVSSSNSDSPRDLSKYDMTRQEMMNFSFDTNPMSEKFNKEKHIELSSLDFNSIETGVQNRCQLAQEKIKRHPEKFTTDVIRSFNDQLKQMLSELKVGQSNHLKVNQINAKKQKGQDNPVILNSRINQLKENKSVLNQQLKLLKDQIENLDLNSDEIKITEHASRIQIKDQSRGIQLPQPEIPAQFIEELKRLIFERDFHHEKQNSEITALRNYIDQIENENSHLKLSNSELIESHKRVKAISDELEKTRIEKREFQKEAEEAIELWKLEVKKLEKLLADNRDELATSNEQFQNLFQKCENFNTANNKLQIENSSLKESIKQFQEKCNFLEKELEDLKVKYESNMAKIREIESTGLEAKKDNKTEDLKEIKSNQLSQKVKTLQSEIKSLTEENKNLISNILKLERDVQILQIDKQYKNDIERDYIEKLNSARLMIDEKQENLTNLMYNYNKLEEDYKEKVCLLKDSEEKNQRVLDELKNQNVFIINTEKDFLNFLTDIGSEIDMIINNFQVVFNQKYELMCDMGQDKLSSHFLIIKDKVSYIANCFEKIVQLNFKYKQEINFLEHDLDSLNKKMIYNYDAQNLFLKNLEAQNSELLSDRAIAVRNIDLFKGYLMSLKECVEKHSTREIERAQHLLEYDYFTSSNKERILESVSDKRIDKKSEANFKKTTNKKKLNQKPKPFR